MDIPLDHLKYNEMWTKPIEQHHISPDIEDTIKSMALQTMNDNFIVISNITNRIINNEFKKHSPENLRKRLLIKNQIINNLTENIKTLTINMAKEKYDMEQSRYYDDNLVPINYYTYYNTNYNTSINNNYELLIPYDINTDNTYEINPNIADGYILLDNTNYDTFDLECDEDLDCIVY
jgi:hypothetical protein